ncbi:MAG: iron-sulfur cluster assembly scaffold protein [Candidatus Falkowbacteria bacterium]|nr:iron-sulfur cluster assembly scaffold protein [Candidatus Falkowbacteria bacterium]
MDIYAENILDHYKHPRNFGTIKGASINHCEANYVCGDKLELDIQMEKDKIKDLKFRGTGCAISQATMSIISEQVIGKTKKQILALKFNDVQKIVGVPISERRLKCAILGLMTLQNALKK